MALCARQTSFLHALELHEELRPARETRSEIVRKHAGQRKRHHTECARVSRRRGAGFSGPPARNARERQLHHGDRTFAAFLNMLLHRFGLFFYRAWARANPVVNLDRLEGAPVLSHVGAFVGLANDAVRERDALGDFAKLHFVGRLATYKYYNMDQVVAQALTLFSRLSESERPTIRDAREGANESAIARAVGGELSARSTASTTATTISCAFRVTGSAPATCTRSARSVSRPSAIRYSGSTPRPTGATSSTFRGLTRG